MKMHCSRRALAVWVRLAYHARAPLVVHVPAIAIRFETAPVRRSYRARNQRDGHSAAIACTSD